MTGMHGRLSECWRRLWLSSVWVALCVRVAVAGVLLGCVCCWLRLGEYWDDLSDRVV